MGLTKGNYWGVKIFSLFPLKWFQRFEKQITANNVSHFFMQRGGHFILIVNFLNLIKIQALHTLWLFQILNHSLCLWGILIKSLLTWPDLFSESLLSPCRFLPVLDVILTGDWSSFTGERDNSFNGDLHCSLTGDMFSLTGDEGPFTGDVNFFCFLWDWWELYLPFLMFVVRKCTLLSWKWLYSSWWRFIWRYLRIIRRGTNIWAVLGFLSVGLTS